MALSVAEAKELAKQAVFKPSFTSLHFSPSASAAQYHFSGAVSADFDLMVKFGDVMTLYFMVQVREVKFKDLSAENMRVINDNWPVYTGEMVRATAEELEGTGFTLGYSNAYDCPEIVEDWVSSPESFFLSLTNYVEVCKDYIRQDLIKHGGRDPLYECQYLK